MTESQHPSFNATVITMTDEDLVKAWEALAEHEDLEPWGKAVIAEMEKREIDF